MQRVDPTYHLVFDDGSQLALTSDLNSMREQLEAIEPGSFQGFLRYVEEGHRHYHLAMDKLVNRDFRTASEFFTPGNVPLLFQLKPLVPHYRHMSAYFKQPRLKAAFTFQDVYMGLSPFEAPATFSMMPYTELAHGVWYPKGGMSSIVEALMQIAARPGWNLSIDTAVERIEVNGTRATGVILDDGRQLEADVVVANADLPYVYQNLLPHDHYGEQMAHKRFSCSTISFFWGVDKPYPQLGPHTLFLADDYRDNFKSIIQDLDLPDESQPVHPRPRAPRSRHGTARGGHADRHRAGRTSGRDRRAGLAAHSRPGAARQCSSGWRSWASPTWKRTSSSRWITPRFSWRKRYNLMKGSTHGLSHTLMQLGYFRPHNRHARYHNLYFVGASTHPGTGVPTALVSARLVAKRIMDDHALQAARAG